MNLKPSTIGANVYNRFTPLPIQETMEAFAHEGMRGVMGALPAATLGIGVGTWEPSSWQSVAMLEDELAEKYYQKPWDELTERDQFIIRKSFPNIEQREKAAKAGGGKFPFVEEMLTQQQEVGQEITTKLPLQVQREMKRLNVTMGGISRTFGQGHFLNNQRYEKYQQIISTEMNVLLPQMMKSRVWGVATDIQKQRLLEASIKEIKKRARTKYRLWEHR